MATLEELDELNIEVINGPLSDCEESSKENPSPKIVAINETSINVVSVPATTVGECEDDEDDFDDETLSERLAGLAEMFPPCVQTTTSKLIFGSISSMKGLFAFARSASWLIFSTSAILFAPVLFEVERAQMEEMQKQQQRQILLGPGAAMSGPGMGMGMVPGPLPR